MTFRVILRKDVIYKNNTSPLCLLFFHDNRKKSVGLGVSVVRSCWDAQAQKVTDDCPDRDDIQFQITAKIKEYEKKIKKLEALEIPVTFEALFETIGKRMDCTVGYYFRQIIDRLEKVEKYGSASKHKVTLALMSQFRSVNMRFDELDLTCLREFEIFLSQKGNVNNSCNYAAFQYWQLYLIEILHQTTTEPGQKHFEDQLYLIEILHQTTTSQHTENWRTWLYLIEILHQTTTSSVTFWSLLCCILLKFYIKPQHTFNRCFFFRVVSYWNSTSNHNKPPFFLFGRYVVSYWNSTSNHNVGFFLFDDFWLYLIEILHQTTTPISTKENRRRLYLIEILHQTTTPLQSVFFLPCCILLKFYIKPQQSRGKSTSRTSCILLKFYIKPQQSRGKSTSRTSCILLKFYIKPQPRLFSQFFSVRCILLKFYIKPQLRSQSEHPANVVSYWNSTSNHNSRSFLFCCPPVVSYWNSTSNHNHVNVAFLCFCVVSYWNSTSNHNLDGKEQDFSWLYLIEILHQTTTQGRKRNCKHCCILLKFYIKPQLKVIHCQ